MSAETQLRPAGDAGGSPATAPPSPPPMDGLPPAQRRRAVIAIMIAIMMATLDIAIANTALPAIAADLRTSAAASVWVINAYQLAMVAALLPCAALGDIVGHRRIYIGGVALFTLASLLCALAWSLPTLAAARLLQGLGAAGVMSVNTALLRFVYPRAQLGRGVGLNATMVAVSFAAGPTIASLILSVGPWPWLFAVNVPFGLLAVVVLLRALPETARSGHRFDLAGALLNAAGFGLLILAIGEAAHQAGPLTLAAELGAALLLILLLVRREASSPAPMLPVDLFRRPLFALSALTSTCSFATQGLAFVSLPFFLQHALGRSQVETGFLMTPWPVAVALMGLIAGPLSDRHNPGLLGGVGLVLLALGMALLATLPADPSVFDIGWRMALCGIGFGFFQSPNMKALMSSAPPERAGGASGIVAMARLIGQTVGAALVALCFTLSPEHGATVALGLGVGFAAVASVASFLRLLTPNPERSR
ncbi:MFS transporter [Roseomonas sp. NAR14]|uniref:MFS transporter n=1 Tax=Roseomonas acroporae TaxID=2937791 RepID=A0A9X1Y5B5_9PROT|nr:MFS transporter [Roseomonas acroporae]MCK8783397.1 MFS transporter [Roseomonas acroporae]